MTEQICLIQAVGRTFTSPAGTMLHRALIDNGLQIETPCGARGYCRKCRVKYTEAAPPPTAADLEQLTPPEIALGYRLSCQQVVTGHCAVAVMPALAPDVKKAGLGRLAQPVQPDPWLSLSPGRAVGLALDIGTTSLVGALLDLRTGEELAALSAPNPQAVYGADLMARLTHAMSGEESAYELQQLVIGSVNRMVERLCSRAGVERGEIAGASMCGNTAMHHLFLGLPIDDLAVAPYLPAVTAGQEVSARTIGLNLAPGAVLYALPNIAGFVGADAVAAALATDMDQGEATVALVDIGTNGEILMRHDGRLYVCSAPAGPAFEGGEIHQGMRAGPGAIERVEFDGDALQIGVIKGAEASGICGSGLLDAVASLLQAGVIDHLGRMRSAGPLAGRVHEGPYGRAVELTSGVVLTQKDIRQLQLAKGAIRSGLDLLMHVTTTQPQTILLAGAFGNYLRRESAIAIGLLPPCPAECVMPVGNAAAMGAKLALLTRAGRERAEALARAAQHLDLATHPDFEEIFLEALNFPLVR